MMSYGLVSTLRIVKYTFDIWNVKELNLTTFASVLPYGFGL